MPPVPEHSAMPLSRALRGVASALVEPDVYDRPPDSGIAVEQRRLFDATGIRSAVVVPLRGTREVLGAFTLGRTQKQGNFTTADLPLIEDIARRASLALDNARLYQRQRAVAETMQNHLLPQMPRVPGLQLAVRYLPAPDASQVGGDWYDAFSLSDGATALAIGDVVGHDPRPPPVWPSCATCCAPTRGRSRHRPAASWSASTRPSCRSPTSRWPPSSAPESLGRTAEDGT